LAIAVMHCLHHDHPMLANIQAFLIVLEEGSLRRAAKRLHQSQSALSRQMQRLEHELGGPLLERMSTGVRPTAGGCALAAKMEKVLSGYEAALVEVRRLLRGKTEQLRIGYLSSAARDHLYPALAEFRKNYPEAKLRLFDLSPGEQILGLRRGEIDVAITHQGAEILSLDFYVRRLASIASVVALPESHPLASRRRVRMSELKGETFVKSPESDVPGYNQKIIHLCRKVGGFKAKFIGQPGSLAEGLELVANDEVIALLPEFVRSQSRPGLRFVRISDPQVTWDLFIVWKRGPVDRTLRALLDALSATTKNQDRSRPIAPARPNERLSLLDDSQA
jgi:DNA-binding transcriptional LysR family regulator